MAGFSSTSTSTFTFKPLHCSSRQSFITPSSSSSSSYSSSLFGTRLLISATSISLTTTITATLTPIFARHGRGGGGGGRKSEFEEDQTFDLSSLRSEQVRLIDEEQNMVGIVTKSQAIQMAEDAELDLVILSPEADPPVVRIMDYNKYRYELQKKKKDQQKKSAASRRDLKELKMGYNIDVHDYSVRLKAAQKFLKDGDKVKVIVNLKGRENEFRNNALQLIRRFQDDIGELATEESKNFRDRSIFIILAPNKAILQRAQEQSKKKNKAANEVTASV